jgi:CRP-like cAMP-binding protein
MLGLERMVNITRPPGATRFEFAVTVEFSVPPSRVKRVLLAAMKELDVVPGFDPDTPPVVLIRDTSALGVEYLLRYWIFPWNPISPTSAEDRVYESVLKHLHTAGIGLAYPKRDLYVAEMPMRQFDNHRREDLVKILRNTALFKPLEEPDLETIADDMHRLHLPAGEELVRQGEKGKSLYILIEGLLDVFVDTEHGEEPVGRIHPGECFGEMSLLTGERRAATVRSSVECIVYEVGKKPIRALMERRPALAATLATLLAERQLGTELALHEQREEQETGTTEGFARQLVARMREFLDLRPADPEVQRPD